MIFITLITIDDSNTQFSKLSEVMYLCIQICFKYTKVFKVRGCRIPMMFTCQCCGMRLVRFACMIGRAVDGDDHVYN